MIFQVSGRGPFPLDMLRYDRCSPASECDSAQIRKTFQRGDSEERAINLFRPDLPNAVLAPTEGRWDSFGYTVVPEGQERNFSC